MNKRYIIFLSLGVSLGGFLFGFDAAVISGVNSFITAQFDLTSLQLGMVVASVSVSSAAAMLMAGGISDRYGRRTVLIVVALLYSISAICSALAFNYTSLVIARLVGGVAFGAALVLVPLYIAETVPSNMRGGMVSLNQLSIVVGFSAAYFSNYYFLQFSTSGSGLAQNLNLEQDIWRWMLGIESIPAIIYFIVLWFVPKSPRWLFMNGQHQQAEANLARINGTEKAAEIMQEIALSIERAATTGHNRLKDSLKNLLAKRYRKILLIGLIIGIAQMSVGINAVFFYATNIFELTGIGTDASFAQSVWVGIINVLFTVLAILLIDKIGRRPLLLAGIAGITISLLIVAYGFKNATYALTPEMLTELSEDIEPSQLEGLLDREFDSDVAFGKAVTLALGRTQATKYKATLINKAGRLNAQLLLIGILGFVACFAFSLGPVMWVLLSEIFPISIRGIGISAIGFINSLTAYLVVQFFPWQIENIGSAWTFLIYALCGLLALILLFKLLPETKGKTLEELEEHLST